MLDSFINNAVDIIQILLRVNIYRSHIFQLLKRGRKYTRVVSSKMSSLKEYKPCFCSVINIKK